LLSLGLVSFLPFCSTDEDTAEYLVDLLSSANDPASSWLFTQERHVAVGAIRSTLEGLRGIGKSYEERVVQALGVLQAQPAPPAT